MSISYSNYYELLDVPSDSTKEEIQMAYHRAKSLYAPDSPALYSMFSKEEAQALLKEIDNAYKVLSNPLSREEYDLSLNGIPNQNSNSTVEEDAIYGLSGESMNQGFEELSTEISPQVMASNMEAKHTSQQAEQPIDIKSGHTKFGEYKLDPEVEHYIEHEANTDGDFLKTVREYKNVNIDQLSRYTKIGKHHIEAIESNQYSKLPPVVFAKGFVKQIAELLGLDGKKCSDNYIELMKQHL